MNTFGQIFRLTSFGESHGSCVGGVIDGCPSGFKIDFDWIKKQLLLRSPASVVGATTRIEEDEVEFISGLFDGVTTGTPLTFIVRNKNVRSGDYNNIYNTFRPGHADYSYQMRYGIRDYRGGGRASARETVVRVVAGAIASQWLNETYGIEIKSFVSQIGDVVLPGCYLDYNLSEANKSILRCPDVEIENQMHRLLDNVADNGDTIGGVVSCVISGVPAGVGEPLYNKFEAELAHAMLSIPAAKGFEYGYEAPCMRGSLYNDAMYMENNCIKFKSNMAGGILGGISTGQDIYFKVPFKPISSIRQMQHSVSDDGDEVSFIVNGRHDICVAPRAAVIVEAMAAMVVINQICLRNLYR